MLPGWVTRKKKETNQLSIFYSCFKNRVVIDGNMLSVNSIFEKLVGIAPINFFFLNLSSDFGECDTFLKNIYF